MINLLDHADGPVFIFTHLMDTHGPDFAFQKQVFSIGSSADKDWDQRRYLDAILSFDGHVKKIYQYLEQTGQLDNTILVIYTDHGFKHATDQRIPIIMHFPKDTHTGALKNNVQVIDIPVTLLDYIGIHSPEWMTGTSLLNGEPSADRKIFSTTTGSPKGIKPPFYQIQTIQVIICQKWYRLNVRDFSWKTGTVIKHTAACDESLLPPDKEIYQDILSYLQEHGYDIQPLQELRQGM
jgi:arylsulfatase A-like enzyme